ETTCAALVNSLASIRVTSSAPNTEPTVGYDSYSRLTRTPTATSTSAAASTVTSAVTTVRRTMIRGTTNSTAAIAIPISTYTDTAIGSGNGRHSSSTIRYSAAVSTAAASSTIGTATVTYRRDRGNSSHNPANTPRTVDVTGSHPVSNDRSVN